MERYVRHRDRRLELVTDGGNRRRAERAGGAAVGGITYAKLRARDGDDCSYCGRPLDFEIAPRGRNFPEKATIEHIVPISAGGAHDWDNVVLACWACNRDKGTQRVDDWAGASSAS